RGARSDLLLRDGGSCSRRGRPGIRVLVALRLRRRGAAPSRRRALPRRPQPPIPTVCSAVRAGAAAIACGGGVRNGGRGPRVGRSAPGRGTPDPGRGGPGGVRGTAGRPLPADPRGPDPG